MDTTVKARLSMERPRGRGAQSVTLRLADAANDDQFMEIKVDVADFAEALFGLQGVDALVTLRHLDRLGWRLEQRTVRLALPAGLDEAGARAALASLEVDGWTGDWPELLNPRRREGGEVLVALRRYVSPVS